MIYIAHRINTIDELKKIPYEYGIEIDVRDFNGRLVLQHDPFISGDDFEEYLSCYKHNTLILNIKSERIEHTILELLEKYTIKKYFFLDSSFPMIYTLTNAGEKNIAIRFSEFEGLDTVLSMAGKVTWVWVDCFTSLPINVANYKLLKDNHFQLCLVSPELQGQPEKIKPYKKYIEKNNIQFDAICTKIHQIPIWQNES